MRLILILGFLGAVGVCSAANILVLVVAPSRSHSILFERLVFELADRGHQLTFVSGYALPQTHKNVEEITVTEIAEFMNKNEGNSAASFMRKLPTFVTMFMVGFIGTKLSTILLENPKIDQLIKSEDKKYDLVLAETFLDEALFAGFAHKFKAPFVGLATSSPNIWSLALIGNPAPASYIPDYLLGFPAKMTFCQRFMNFVYGLLVDANYHLIYIPKQDALMRQYFGEHLPPIQSIIRNTSLVLVNSHYSLSFPRPYLPNMVEIGGYHVPPPKALPKDIQNYMDASKEGVVLCSLGSAMNASKMPEEKIREFSKGFSKLKQNVLWKFENENLPGLPKNVKISKWLPQSDILNHTNLRLFITHGGQLSLTEAVLRGVPVVGIPLMADQPANIKAAETSGIGKGLSFADLTGESLYETAKEVIDNPKYKQAAQEKSRLLTDTLMPPIDLAIYWIEYVLRHDGAPHMKSAVQDLTWSQEQLLDVIATLLLSTIIVAYCNFYITRLVFRTIKSCFCKKKENVTPGKKKN